MPSTDSAYREVSHQHGVRNRRRKDRNALAADFGRKLEGLEDATRALLFRLFRGSESRILKFTEMDEGHQSTKFHELDFVVVTDSVPSVFFEIKFRENHKQSKVDGVGQLYDNLDIARCRWPEIRGVCVNIFTGFIFGLAEREPEGLDSLTALSVIVDTLDQRQIPVAGIWLSGAELLRAANIPTKVVKQIQRSRTAAMNSIEARHRQRQGIGCIGHLFELALH